MRRSLHPWGDIHYGWDWTSNSCPVPHAGKRILTVQARTPPPPTPLAVDPTVQPWVQKYPLAWAETAGVGLAKCRPPIIVKLKVDATPIWVKQYPMSQEARQGISPHIQRLLKAGILRMSIPMEYTPTTGEKAWGNGFQASPGSS